jgi:hypothetical protein
MGEQVHRERSLADLSQDRREYVRFRKTRARLAALALHHADPSLAKRAGQKGGSSTAEGYKGGRRAWGVAMAMRRWHGTKFTYDESRAPEAGPGGDGSGVPEPGPATAPSEPVRGKRRRQKRS